MNVEIKPGKNDRENMVCGELTFSTAANLLAHGKSLIVNHTSIHFNLSQVTHCSSVGLAVLIAWCRIARQLGKSISFSHLPTNLLSAAQVSNLDSVLPLESVVSMEKENGVNL
jgi:phospholipid transport system transporter-binding protein